MAEGKKKFVQKRRIVKLDFKGTDYEGLEVDANLSLPYGMLQAAAKGDKEKALELMPLLIVDWNICDPVTDDFLPVNEEGMGKVGLDVLMFIFETAMNQLKAGGVDPNAGGRSDNS